MKHLIALFVIYCLAGCATSNSEDKDFYPLHFAHSVHMVSTLEDMQGGVGPGKAISARGRQFVVAGFASDTDYVEQAYKKLLSECPEGEIKDISTEFLTSMGFSSWTNKIFIQAKCYN